MYFVQIFLVFFGVFVYVTQQLNPPANVNEAKKEKQTEKNNDDLGHVNPEKNRIFMANLPKPYPRNSKENIVLNANLLENMSSSQALNDHTSDRKVGSSNVSSPKTNQTLEENTDELSSGAITRGIMVFVALSFLFILYVGIKTYRRKPRDKRNTIVTKYGVRGRRSDVEMEPLPLSDDDEDETVFDLTASRGNT